MSDIGGRAGTRAAIRAVLAADCACPESAFLDDELFVTAAGERPGRRRYPIPAKPLRLITMGRGVVVSCHPAWIAPLREMLAGRSREEIYSAPSVAGLSRFVAREGGLLLGPALSLACAPESFRPPIRTASRSAWSRAMLSARSIAIQGSSTPSPTTRTILVPTSPPPWLAGETRLLASPA